MLRLREIVSGVLVMLVVAALAPAPVSVKTWRPAAIAPATIRLHYTLDPSVVDYAETQVICDGFPLRTSRHNADDGRLWSADYDLREPCLYKATVEGYNSHGEKFYAETTFELY